MRAVLSRVAWMSPLGYGAALLFLFHTQSPGQPAPAVPAGNVDLVLVLAVDASGSVDHVRFELQKQGYVAAFRHPHVIGAIQSGPRQAIAAAMMQWTGPALQARVVEWARIGDAASAGAFADAIARAPRALFGGGTSLSGAIDAGQAWLFESPFKAERRVIDISGDGSNNRARSVTTARDEAVAAGIGINGLPILALEPDLDRYYEDNVIGGPGAFVIAAKNYESFAEAILKKLITEIAAAIPDHGANARVRASSNEYGQVSGNAVSSNPVSRAASTRALR